MADSPFDRELIHLLEKPTSSDINKSATYADRALRDFIEQLSRGRAALDDPSGVTPTKTFIGDSFRVVPGTGLAISVTAGLGFYLDGSDVPTSIDGISNVDDLSPLKPLVLSADKEIALAAADPTNPRIDLVEVTHGRRTTDASSRLVFDTGLSDFAADTVTKTLSWDLFNQAGVGGSFKLKVKTGTPAGSPSAPSVDAGYVAIANVRVPATATTILPGSSTAANAGIVDLRQLYLPHNHGLATIRVTLATSGTGDAAINQFGLPPGVFVVVTQTDAQAAAGDGAHEVFVIAGARPASIVHLGGATQIAGNSAPAVTTGLVTATTVLDSTMVGQIAGLTASASPAIDAAIGQPVTRFQGSISAGTIQDPQSGVFALGISY